MGKVMLFPADKKIEQGDIIKCISDSNHSPEKGKLGYCYDEAWFDLKRSYWQAQHLYIVEHGDLSVGDWCMFYNSPSKVIEINGDTAKIESITIVDKEDASFINSIIPKANAKAGDFGKMTHGFSIKNLPKIIASTDKELNLLPIPSSFSKIYVLSHNNKAPILEVEMELRYDLSKKENKWVIITNPIKKETLEAIIKKKSKTPDFIIEHNPGDGKWKVWKKYHVRGWRDLAIQKLNRKAELFPMLNGHQYRTVDK